MRSQPRIQVVALSLCLVLLFGCTALVRTRTGVAPTRLQVSELKTGASLREVLELCGAPLETLVQPDGLLLVYRERYFNYTRVGFEPGLLVGAVDITGLVAGALSNLQLVLQWGFVSERRLVVLFDSDERVSAYAFRDRRGRR